MSNSTSVYLSLRSRVVIFVLYLAGAYAIHGLATGLWKPPPGGKSLWLLSALGLLAFRLLTAPFFNHPKDSFATSLTGFFVLWTVNVSEAGIFSSGFSLVRDWSSGIIGVIAAAGGLAILLKDVDSADHPVLDQIRASSYWLSVSFGTGEVVFTVPAFIGIFAFYPWQPFTASLLTAGWIVIATVKPLEAAWRFLLRAKESRAQLVRGRIGDIHRIDSPNLIRVSLREPESWDSQEIHVASFADGTVMDVLPLFSQIQNEGLLGTGLCVGERRDGNESKEDLRPGGVFSLEEPEERKNVLEEICTFEGEARLVGFVVERSKIGTIRFEVAQESQLREGNVVLCEQEGETVYYQILGAEIAEEAFERNPRGTQIVKAFQLGHATGDGGFRWYPWVPEMNTPVFLPEEEEWPESELEDGGTEGSDELELGNVPGTPVTVTADFDELAEFHTAILGITGMGKTELVFDIIRHGTERDAKIICIDFTGEYEPRLSDLTPSELGFSDERISELSDLIEAVETGEFGAKEEKGELLDFLREIRPEVQAQVDDFLREEGGSVGIFRLEEIANTRATLRATELYISEIFKWAREHRGARRILLVLEEAHTIIPEMNLFRYDNSDTEAVVGRMSQIALQGRKYGVGLLLVSQRTALVRKTILSQCNTYLTFGLVDQTSLKYLQNVYGRDHAEMISDLRPREVLAFGKGVSAEKPIMFEIPFDSEKLAASENVRSSGADLEPATETTEAEDRGDIGDGEEQAAEEPEDEEATGGEAIGGEDALPF